MKALIWRRSTLMVALALLAEVSVEDYNNIGIKLGPLVENQDVINSISRYDGSVGEEYIRHVHSMVDAYRGDAGGAAGARMVIETNALVDTKFRAWKRNADIINSLLGLPKGMNEAGR